MAEPIETKRRLAAIFVADVEGYSRLMGVDEVATLDALTARREILDGLIATHGGRIANTAGDSVLAEFGSAVDAVRCAMEAQDALAEANSALPQTRHINFRMGIHVGDVMVRGGDLFGDGVNIAARLQVLAQPGSVYISGATYEQVTFGGGGASSALWGQSLADCFGVDVRRLANPRTTNAHGAALLALAEMGHIAIADVPALLVTAQLHEPDADAHRTYARLLPSFIDFHDRTAPFYDALNSPEAPS